MVTFDSIAGVPVHYDRQSHSDYGTRGRPSSFQAKREFVRKLDQAFDQLWGYLGVAEVITTAGFYVDKPGWHRKGKAMDLDGIFWPDREFVASKFTEQPILYLAVESCLRLYNGTILDYFYNKYHRDHLHIQDDNRDVFLPSSASQTFYLQAVLNFIYGEDLGIDGVYGPITYEATQRVFDALDLDMGQISGHWHRFLKLTAQEAVKKLKT